MRKCRFCGQEIQDASRVCEHCGRDLMPSHAPEAPPLASAPSSPVAPPTIARVSIVDVNMPFASMVGFMVKWAIAAIPAFLILAVIGAVLAGILAAIGMSFR
jgi:hypothetical protein